MKKWAISTLLGLVLLVVFGYFLTDRNTKVLTVLLLSGVVGLLIGIIIGKFRVDRYHIRPLEEQIVVAKAAIGFTATTINTLVFICWGVLYGWMLGHYPQFIFAPSGFEGIMIMNLTSDLMCKAAYQDTLTKQDEQQSIAANP